MQQKLKFLFFNPRSAFIFAALISFVLHLRIFSVDLIGTHVWRQSETQLNIRHFAKDDFNILHPRTNRMDNATGIHRMEFPLMQWIVAGLDRIFGYSIFVSRIFIFLLGLISILGIMKLSAVLFSDPRAPAIGAWTFSFSPLFYYYTLNPLPDMMSLCFGIWGLAMGMYWLKNKNSRSLILSGCFLAIAALTKLPFILYFVIFPCYWWLSRKGSFIKSIQESLVGWIFILLPLAWYVIVIPTWVSNPVTMGILDSKAYSISGLLYHLWGNFSSTLPELLINYAALPFFIAGVFFLSKKEFYSNSFFIYLATVGCCVFGYFIFELHLIATNHDYYLFPFLPLLFMIIVFGAIRIMQFRTKSEIIVVALICILPLTAFLRINPRWDLSEPGFNPDIMTHASEIRKIIPEDALVINANDQSSHIWFYYLDRSGWSYYKDSVDQNEFAEKIRNGYTYFISDSRKIEKELSTSGLLGNPLDSFGTIRVFRLAKKE